MLKYIVSVVVVFVLGTFVEHNFKVVQHVQQQCPHIKAQLQMECPCVK